MGDAMKVKIGVSARHVHLTKEDFEYLFGMSELTKYRDLTQKGEFAANEKVTIKTNKGEFNNVRILGPFRSYTQVEISKTDAYVLGINPPIRSSGDLSNSETITICNGDKMITKECCIIANRHLHVNNSDLIKYNLKDKECVKIKIGGIKGAVLDNVYIKSSDNYVLECHLDLDDANANLINNGDEGEIVYE